MSKLSIKLGAFEVSYEGTDDFIKRDLLGLLSSISEIATKSKTDEAAEGDGGEETTPPQKRRKGITEKEGLQSTTGSIASKMDCKSGPDLIIAACAYLTFVKGQVVCKRADIIAQMKSAKSYYKKNYVSNLTSYLLRLVRAVKLNEPKNNEYALEPKYVKELKGTLDIN